MSDKILYKPDRCYKCGEKYNFEGLGTKGSVDEREAFYI